MSDLEFLFEAVSGLLHSAGGGGRAELEASKFDRACERYKNGECPTCDAPEPRIMWSCAPGGICPDQYHKERTEPSIEERVEKLERDLSLLQIEFNNPEDL